MQGSNQHSAVSPRAATPRTGVMQSGFSREASRVQQQSAW